MKKILTFLLAVIGLTSACGHSNYENTNVEYKCVNLKGGIIAWKEAGKPVTTE